MRVGVKDGVEVSFLFTGTGVQRRKVGTHGVERRRLKNEYTFGEEGRVAVTEILFTLFGEKCE